MKGAIVALLFLALSFALQLGTNLDGASSWKAGINDNFKGMSQERVQKLLGWKPNPNRGTISLETDFIKSRYREKSIK